MFRPTRDTRGLPSAFAYRAFTVCGATFQKLLLASDIPKPGPATPRTYFQNSTARFRTGTAVKVAAGFGLVRVRSHLLAESRLVSSPAGTEMVHFPACSYAHLWIQCAVPRKFGVGCPIRKSPDQSPRAAPRGLSQLTTSFIACRRQGIHLAPLPT